MPGGANAGGILRYLTVAGLALLALMMSLEVNVGFAAPPVARLLFWSLQIAAGLLVLQSLLYLLTRRYGASRIPSWSLVLLSAVLGAAVLAPIYWLIGEVLMQQWLGYPALPDEDGDGAGGALSVGVLLAEFLDIVGPLTTAWALVCLPRLHWLVPPLLHVRTGPAVPAPRPPAVGSTAADRPTGTGASPGAAPAPPDPAVPGHAATASAAGLPPSADSPPPDAAAAAPRPAAPRPSWCERLPTELGTDIIAVASELQYLRVWTPRGCALILGALADVETEGADQGLRVHRSWWVACEHISSVRRTATGAVCLMSDGRQVPVSRRRRAEVLARFGDGAQYRAAGESKAVAHTDLH
jgi:hypothetical protein